MAVVLGLVLTASVLSGPAKDSGGDYGLDTVGSAGSGSNVCRDWPGDPILQLGWLPQLQEEALGGGRDANSEMPTVWTLLVCRPQVPYMWDGGVDDPAFLDDSRLLRARADVARSLALRVAGETVPAQGSTEAAQDLVLEGEALDGSLNRRDTETGSTGDLFWLTTYTCEEGYCGFTANNVQVAEYTLEGYRMAACSEHWAFGTRFLVAGRWLVECQDRGSGVVLPNHLDVYFPTAKEAAAWLAQVGDHARVEVRP